MDKNNKAIIESILYVVGDDGTTVADIKKVVDISSSEIRSLLKSMQKECDMNISRGITIKNFDDTFKFLTKESVHDDISRLFDIKQKNPLTSSLLETLAIIAYNSPCPSSKVEQVRGKSALTTIEKLLKLKLIINIGRADTPGRPYLYEVTNNFYNIFGIKSIKELPNINFSDKDDENIESIDFFDSNTDH